jgi:hypothetical protein
LNIGSRCACEIETELNNGTRPADPACAVAGIIEEAAEVA